MKLIANYFLRNWNAFFRKLKLRHFVACALRQVCTGGDIATGTGPVGVHKFTLST